MIGRKIRWADMLYWFQCGFLLVLFSARVLFSSGTKWCVCWNCEDGSLAIFV